MEALLAWAVLPSLGWRWLLALSALPLGMLLVLYPLLPESPHWLVSQQRYPEAEAVLQRIAAANGRTPLQLCLSPGKVDGHSSADGRQQLTSAGSYSGVRSRSPVHAAAALSPTPGVQAPLLPAAAGPGRDSLQQSGRQALAASAAGVRQQSRRSVDLAEGGGSSSAWWSSLSKVVMAAFSTVLSPQLRRTSLLLYIIWSVNALTYCEPCALAEDHASERYDTASY
jgi:hypothetical protein